MDMIDRLARMRRLLATGLSPFVSHKLAERYGTDWRSRARLPERFEGHKLDAHACLYAILNNWHDVFQDAMPRAARSAASSALEGRNAEAHVSGDIDRDLSLRALIAGAELLAHVKADEVEEASRLKDEALREELKIEDLPARRKVARGHVAKAEVMADPKGDYWVYENWTHKRAIVHLGGCSFCNHGQGMHAGAGARNGRWLGPFENRARAVQAAQRTGQADARACGMCDR